MDIALATEMLYMSTVPDSYDIAVIVTGDKDFLPVLQRTRLKGKRVAVCSMKNSCNRDLYSVDSNSKDFDVIWIDDYVEDLIKPKAAKGFVETVEGMYAVHYVLMFSAVNLILPAFIRFYN